MSSTYVAILITFALVAWIGTSHVLMQYILPASKSQTEVATRYKVPRRHLESVRSWEARTWAVLRALHDADEAFVREANRLGRVEHFSERGLLWSLPSSHPAAVALTLARFPDGPSAEEILRIASGECIQVGVDLLN